MEGMDQRLSSDTSADFIMPNKSKKSNVIEFAVAIGD